MKFIASKKGVMDKFIQTVNNTYPAVIRMTNQTISIQKVIF
jgi:hypothetical protein